MQVLRLFGPNPYPAAGTMGHVAGSANALAALVVVIVIAGVLSQGDPNRGTLGNDFLAFLTGARMLADGDVAHLYDRDIQLDRQQALRTQAGARADRLNMYVNPPLLALLVAPLLPVGAFAGVWVWRLLTVALAAFLLLRIARQDKNPPVGRRSPFLLLAFFPFIEAMQYGQLAMAMLGAFGGWFLLVRDGRSRAAGVVLSLMLLKPQYVPFMVLFLMWKRQWRQLSGFVLGGSIQAVITLAVFLASGQVPTIDGLIPHMSFDGGGLDAFVFLQLNIRAAIWHLLPMVNLPIQLILLVALTLGAMLGFLIWVGRDWRTDPRALAWEALALAGMLCLTAYHNHLDTLYVLLPPLAALVTTRAARPEERPWALPSVAALLALPSGAFLAAAGYTPYYLAGWVTALCAILIPLVLLRPGSGFGKALKLSSDSAR
jgi:hypothetical protein